MKKYESRLKASQRAGFFLQGKLVEKQLNRRKWSFHLHEEVEKHQATPLNSNSTKGELLPLRRLYGMRLRAKQTLKAFYGNISEKQFKKLYNSSNFKSLGSKRHLVQLLESRLDSTIYRLGFARSIFEAKQLIRHGAFSVNGKEHFSKSLMLSPGDLIEVNGTHRSFIASNVLEVHELGGSHPGSHLMVNFETLSAIYLQDVDLTEVVYPGPINFKHIKEFYI